MVDNSPLRRGHPAAHLIYGTALTLHSSNYVFAMIQAKIFETFPDSVKMKAIEYYTEAMLEFHMGQGMLIFLNNFRIRQNENGSENTMVNPPKFFYIFLLF